MQSIIGFCCVILAGIGFGFLGIFGKLAFLSGMSVGELLTFRFSFAAIIMWIALLIFRRDLIKISFRQILISSGLGVFGYAVFSTLYFESIKGLSVSLAALLLFMFPIFVNLGEHFILKRKMTSRQMLSLLLATVGIGILLWGPVFFESLWFIIFALGAAVAYSIYVLVSGVYQQGVQPLSSSLYVITASAVALFLFHRPDLSRLQQFSGDQLYYIFGLSIVCTILPITLFLIGLQRLSSGVASIVVMIEPVVAALAAWAILGEKLTALQYLGMLLVFISLALNSTVSSKTSSSVSP